MLGAGFLFVGQGVTIDGAIAIPRTHRPIWVWQLWDRPRPAVVALERLNEPEARRHLAALKAVLAGSEIRGSALSESERSVFNVTSDAEVDVRFDTDARELVRTFLTQ